MGYRRDGSSSASNVQPLSVREVWNALQAELKSLMWDWLNDSKVSKITLPSGKGGVHFVQIYEKKTQSARKRDLFSFSHTASALSVENERKDSGSANDATRSPMTAIVPRSNGFFGLKDSTVGGADSLASSHRQYVRSDSSYILFLFRPVLAFVRQLALALPQAAPGSDQARREEAGELETFLHEFILHFYLPHMKESIMSRLDDEVDGPDSWSLSYIRKLMGRRQTLQTGLLKVRVPECAGGFAVGKMSM